MTALFLFKACVVYQEDGFYRQSRTVFRLTKSICLFGDFKLLQWDHPNASSAKWNEISYRLINMDLSFLTDQK